MALFFVKNEAVSENHISLTGADYNHLKNVLRSRIGERVTVSDEKGWLFECEIEAFQADSALLRIIFQSEGKNELKAEITLFQGLPKSDKLELIIQKAVELGASEIVPVEMKRTIVKVEPKKEA